MTNNEIFQGNQYIALFMGWTSDEIETYLIARNGQMRKLAFNESWDLLMPVIEKIEGLPTDKRNGKEFQFSITGDGISITKYDDGSGIVASRYNEIGKSKLQATFECVVSFCKEKLDDVVVK